MRRWLFEQPTFPYHRNGPLMTMDLFRASVLIQVRDHWKNMGPFFDPFYVESQASDGISFGLEKAEQHVDSTITESACNVTRKSSNCIRDFNTMFTPVSIVSSGILVGYVLISGPSFDGLVNNNPQGTFKGRSHIQGRFAYDRDNDHVIMVFHGVAPQVSGILDITSNGVSRIRTFYTVMTGDCAHGKVPMCPVTMVSNVEVKLHFEELFSNCRVSQSDGTMTTLKPTHETLLSGDKFFEDEVCENESRDDGSVRDRSDSMWLGVPNKLAINLMEMTTKLNCLASLMQGKYNGDNVNRIAIPIRETMNKYRFCQNGSVFTEHTPLNKASYGENVRKAWQLYTMVTFRLQPDRLLRAAMSEKLLTYLMRKRESGHQPKNSGNEQMQNDFDMDRTLPDEDKKCKQMDVGWLESKSFSMDEPKYGVHVKLQRHVRGRISKHVEPVCFGRRVRANMMKEVRIRKLATAFFTQ